MSLCVKCKSLSLFLPLAYDKNTDFKSSAFSVSNLQYWANNEQLIRRTLELFNELATGYGASKNLRKIETTRLILQNHMASQFAFCQNEKQSENRILYFQVLCKLLFADDNVDERTFYEFMKPFDIRISNLGALDSVEAFRQETTRVSSSACNV